MSATTDLDPAPGTPLVIGVATGDDAVARAIEDAVHPRGDALVRARSLDELDSLAQRHDLDVLLLDSDLLTRDGSSRVRALTAAPDPLPVVIIEPGVAPHAAFDLLAAGARDVLRRAPHPVEVRLRVAQAVDARALSLRLANLEEEITERSRKSFTARTLVNNSPTMERLSETIQRVAKMRTTVLVRGESGVGKELVARALHFNSPRREAPFITINCAALPPHLIESELFGHERGAFTGAVSRRAGKFELAHHGTLFLDEIGETDLPTQAKLLRVLEQQEFMRVGGSRPVRVAVRLVAATNADLEALVREGGFREDLYYRLKVVTLEIPPLRERREDIPELAQTFLQQICRQNQLRARRLTASALDALTRYPWPGNVRELKNTLEAVVVATPSETLDIEHLPAPVQSMTASPAYRAPRLAGRTLRDIEAEAIRATLTAVGGSRTEAARQLGIGIRTLRRRLREYGLDELLPPRPGRPRRPRS